MLVPLGELSGDLLEKDVDLFVGERHDSFDDPGDPL
jgi:hypothetical protein